MQQTTKLFLMAITLIGAATSLLADNDSPDQAQQLKTLRDRIETLTRQIDENPDTTALYSSRGDAYFFSGQAKQSVADYSRMVELDPRLDSSHWRRGIALFYDNQFEEAAKQFDRYHSFDDVDRENGIWRYFSHYRAKGAESARKELLKYEKDDREPFGDVYKLFSAEMTSRQIMDKIKQADLSDSEREKRLFYASLYIGLNEAVEGRPDNAKTFLAIAAANDWAPNAGYGPHYMWQVAHVQLQQLQASK